MLGRNVNISNLYTSYALRYRGLYIRCINKQKTVLDLTYMQEMTPEIAGFSSQPLDYFLDYSRLQKGQYLRGLDTADRVASTAIKTAGI